MKGSEISAMEFYEKAIDYGKKINLLSMQALANELYAKFWLKRGQEKISAIFMSEACRNYENWGASAKVEKLQRKYPDLFDSQTNLLSKKASETNADNLDIFSVTKAAQAITGEIELEKLVTKLMNIAIENAGAERGSLILEHNGEFSVLCRRISGRNTSFDTRCNSAFRCGKSAFDDYKFCPANFGKHCFDRCKKR